VSGWSVFVSKKRLLPGDGFIFLRFVAVISYRPRRKRNTTVQR
jgi:hypothetical protein